MTTWRDRWLAIIVALVFVASLALSLAHGTPSKLPGVALGWPALLHVERAAAAAVVIAVAAVVLFQLWQGRLPTKLPGGVEFPERAEVAVERNVREQLIQVEREARAAFDGLRIAVERLASGLPTEATLESLDKAARAWDGALDDAEKRDALADAITALPEREKLVIALSVYEGLPDSEIAKVLGVSHDRVRLLRARALQALRRRLGSDPFPDN